MHMQRRHDDHYGSPAQPVYEVEEHAPGRPLRVLMGILNPSIRGGPAGHLPFLVRELRAMGVEVHEAWYGNALGAIGWRGRLMQILRTIRELRDVQRRTPCDIVQLNTSFDVKALVRDLLVVSSLRRQGQKVVLKFHGSEAGLIGTRSPLLRLLIKALLAQVHAAGVLSREERDNFIRAGFEGSKILIVKNILDPSLYKPDPGFRRRYGLSAEVPVLLYAARFIPGKGVMDAVKACGVLAERGEEAVLICAGDGPEREAAEMEAKRLGIEGRIRFTGFLPEKKMRELYASATLLIFPTYYDEGFPMVVFQSVAAGLPVITTRRRGAADYLREPLNCRWTLPRDPAMLADRVQELLRNPELRASMSAANRELAGNFTADKVAAEFVGLYERLLAAPARAPRAASPAEHVQEEEHFELA
jgi:glycosyltransferase involved in cell wall biosynthesis